MVQFHPRGILGFRRLPLHVVTRLHVSSIGTVLRFLLRHREFAPNARQSGQEGSKRHHPVRLESPRWRVEMQVLCLVRWQFRSSHDDESLHLGRKILFETTLHFTKFVVNCAKVAFRCSNCLIQSHFRPALQAQPPNTIENDFGLLQLSTRTLDSSKFAPH